VWLLGGEKVGQRGAVLFPTFRGKDEKLIPKMIPEMRGREANVVSLF